MKTKFLAIVVICYFFTCSCKKEHQPGTPNHTDEGVYFSKVKTIINTNCTISCHAPSKGFNQGLPVILETDDDIASCAAGIKASVADSATLTNKRMPLGSSLSATDIDIIVKWAAKGGKTTD